MLHIPPVGNLKIACTSPFIFIKFIGLIRTIGQICSTFNPEYAAKMIAAATSNPSKQAHEQTTHNGSTLDP